MSLTRMPLALASAVLLIAGAARVASSGELDGIALLTAGMICLGAWLGAEASSVVIERREARRNQDLPPG